MGMLCTLLCIVLIVLLTIYPSDSAPWWVYLAFVFFAGVGVTITLYGKKWEVRASGNEIHITTLFGRTKTYTFDSITQIKSIVPENIIGQYNADMSNIIIYSGDESILSMSWYYKGYKPFLDRLLEHGHIEIKAQPYRENGIL